MGPQKSIFILFILVLYRLFIIFLFFYVYCMYIIYYIIISLRYQVPLDISQDISQQTYQRPATEISLPSSPIYFFLVESAICYTVHHCLNSREQCNISENRPIPEVIYPQTLTVNGIPGNQVNCDSPWKKRNPHITSLFTKCPTWAPK